MPKNWNHGWGHRIHESMFFICESFWVIYTSFDVKPLMLGQHQQRDTSPFPPPLFFSLLVVFYNFSFGDDVWPLFFRIVLQVPLSVSVPCSANFVCRHVGWGGGIWPRVKLLIKSTGSWRKLTRSIFLTPFVSSLRACWLAVVILLFLLPPDACHNLST